MKGKFEKGVGQYYSSVAEVLKQSELIKFIRAVNDLYHSKITSEVELPSYQISKEEIGDILVSECGLDLNVINKYVSRL